MTETEILALCGELLTERDEPFPKPTEQNWKQLREKFHCDFDEAFISFINLQSTHYFVLETFLAVDVSEDQDAGNIGQMYDMERAITERAKPWNPALVPFAAVGNGDIICLFVDAGYAAAVWYVYHEDDTCEKASGRFADWLKSFVAEC